MDYDPTRSISSQIAQVIAGLEEGSEFTSKRLVELAEFPSHTCGAVSAFLSYHNGNGAIEGVCWTDRNLVYRLVDKSVLMVTREIATKGGVEGRSVRKFHHKILPKVPSKGGETEDGEAKETHTAPVASDVPPVSISVAVAFADKLLGLAIELEQARLSLAEYSSTELEAELARRGKGGGSATEGGK